MNRRPLSDEHKMRIGATMLGIRFEEYRAKIEAGLKHCFGCHDWHPRSAFPRRANAAGGLNNECRDCMNPRARAYWREKRAAAGAA